MSKQLGRGEMVRWKPTQDNSTPDSGYMRGLGSSNAVVRKDSEVLQRGEEVGVTVSKLCQEQCLIGRMTCEACIMTSQ